IDSSLHCVSLCHSDRREEPININRTPMILNKILKKQCHTEKTMLLRKQRGFSCTKVHTQHSVVDFYLQFTFALLALK
ncbi:MAG TPA: hypothetical protein VFC87_08680, partial [Perlabentimonas sp.]|nr:hypothetical protein [Perlabentimonas sp.]